MEGVSDDLHVRRQAVRRRRGRRLDHRLRYPVMRRLIVALTAAGLLIATRATAQVAVSANDGKAALVDGVTSVTKTPSPDTVTVLDLSVWPPRITGEVR